jgi:hypothetical protein
MSKKVAVVTAASKGIVMGFDKQIHSSIWLPSIWKEFESEYLGVVDDF